MRECKLQIIRQGKEFTQQPFLFPFGFLGVEVRQPFLRVLKFGVQARVLIFLVGGLFNFVQFIFFLVRLCVVFIFKSHICILSR